MMLRCSCVVQRNTQDVSRTGALLPCLPVLARRVG